MYVEEPDEDDDGNVAKKRVKFADDMRYVYLGPKDADPTAR